MLVGLFVSSVSRLKQWAWNNVALLVLTGLTYDLSLTALDRVDTLQEKHNALSKRLASAPSQGLKPSPVKPSPVKPWPVASNIAKPVADAVADAVAEEHY